MVRGLVPAGPALRVPGARARSRLRVREWSGRGRAGSRGQSVEAARMGFSPGTNILKQGRRFPGVGVSGRETLAGHQVSLGDLGAGLGLPADARRWVCALQTGTEVFRRPRARRDMLEQQSTEPGWAGARSGALFQDHR